MGDIYSVYKVYFVNFEFVSEGFFRVDGVLGYICGVIVVRCVFLMYVMLVK